MALERDFGTDDKVLLAIYQSVPENSLVLRPGLAPVERTVRLGERPERLGGQADAPETNET